MNLSLHLRNSVDNQAAIAAWFLPGDEVARWTDELSRAGLGTEDTRLFLVPRSLHDRSVAGLLVLPGDSQPPSSTRPGLPCQRLGSRLFLPVDAKLEPPLTPEEIDELFSWPVNFLHPVHGLSGFDEESTLRIWDLLIPPPPNPVSWNLAQDGAPPLPKLEAVVLVQQLSISELFGEAGQDIGTESPSELPSAPDEPSRLKRSGRSLKRFVAEGLERLLRFAPRTAKQPTWIDHLSEWAQRQLQHAHQELDRMRHKELHRLLHLLENDPEKGLRHAIPMNPFGPRGIAPPGGRLTEHDLKFDPKQFGGRSADLWDVPPDVELELRRRYRLLADRELRLGRHRRAAYIYAHLLGDLLAAANALKQGGCFYEAALLYEEHLRNPREAARCFEQAGLLVEAVTRYEKLDLWLDAANCWERLEKPAAASAALRKAVNRCLDQGDVVGAARLLEQRLHEQAEALTLLRGGWPHSSQAVKCLSASIDLLARMGRHEATLETLAGLRRGPISSTLIQPLLRALESHALRYPDTRVRERAADLSRVLIARQLTRSTLTSLDVAQLTEALARLDLGDRLLARDAGHFKFEYEASRTALLRPRTTAGKEPVARSGFELPRRLRWLAVRVEGPWFFAVGVTHNLTTMVRGVWEGMYQTIAWPSENSQGAGIYLEPTLQNGSAVALTGVQGNVFNELMFPAVDLFFSQECKAGTPSWLASVAGPFAYGADCVWSAHATSGQAILGCYDKLGNLRHTREITDDLLNGAQCGLDARLLLAARGQDVAVALGNRLLLFREKGPVLHLELPGQAVGLVATRPHARKGLVICLDRGACMFWDDSNHLIELDRDLPAPLCAFVPNGPLVLVSEGRGELLDVDSRGVHGVTRFTPATPTALAVCPTNTAREFALMDSRGVITLYHLPL